MGNIVNEKMDLKKKFEILSENIFYIQALSKIGSWTYDVQTRETFWTEGIYNILDCTEEECKSRIEDFFRYIHSDDRQKAIDAMRDGFRGNSYDIDYRIITPKGIEKHVNEKTEVILDKSGRTRKIIGVLQEVTGVGNISGNLDGTMDNSEQTKLPNRALMKRYLEELCSRNMEKKSPFGVIMLSIDNFKDINDILGHKFGDDVIVETMKRLEEFSKENGQVYRYSEDRLGIIIQNLKDPDAYERYTQDLVEIFKTPYELDKYELNIGVNIGGSIYPDDSDEFESLIKYANIALLRSKKEGKNRIKFYSSNMEIQNYKELILRSDLKKSIEKGQIKVYYQPQVNLTTHEIVAAEALVRWEHPEWGTLSPEEFIPIAEESDFIITLGNWILEEVCRDYKRWIDKKRHPIDICVNYSSIQFFEIDFIRNIKGIINNFALEPSFLTIEITEDILMVDREKAIACIKSVQELGVKVAIDDFGTGCSSLAYLNTFNIDILKIDRSFIRDIPRDETSTIITSSIIDMAKKLDINVVAEGIENWDQLSYLRNLNCHLGQGYLYSEAVSSDKFEKILFLGRCRPKIPNNAQVRPREERRKFFRINFYQYLESTLTILEIGGKRTSLANTRVLVKNIGPGGLCFVSNIRFPVKRDVILKFNTRLLDEEIEVYGCPVWTREIHEEIYEYGIEFTFDENKRVDIIRILNQVQIKMRNNMAFSDGSFTTDTPILYFKGKN